jgi:hypothetical protein
MISASDPVTFDRLMALLRAAGYPVVHARQDPDCFGSWTITVGTLAGSIRVVLDGREGEVLLLWVSAATARERAGVDRLWSADVEPTMGKQVVERLRRAAAPSAGG